MVFPESNFEIDHRARPVDIISDLWLDFDEVIDRAIMTMACPSAVPNTRSI